MEIRTALTRGNLDYTSIRAPFDDGKLALENAGYRIISAEENAELRTHISTFSFMFQDANWAREGFIYVPKKGIFLTKNSPIMEDSEAATNMSRLESYYFINGSQVESALADSVEVSGKSIPTNRFAEEEITSYIFGKNAKRYGEFLKENKINSVPIWLTSPQDKPLATQLWLHGVGYSEGSALDGCGGGLHCDSKMRGVRDVSKAA